jgi:hypothetical protein
MKIAFTLNQMEQFALSETRFYEFYNAARSYQGIETGTFWGATDLMDFLMGETLIKWDGEDGKNVSMRGRDYSLDMVRHSIFVHISMLNLKTALHGLKNKKEGYTVSTVAKLQRHLKSLLDSVEW